MAAAIATRADGSEVRPGDTVTDFRGDTATFVSAYTRPAPSTGRVVVRWPDCTMDSEYYPRVFDLSLHDAGEPCPICAAPQAGAPRCPRHPRG